ncbi:MAG: DUF483 domain-containing protein [Candidatus Bathyarchaeota archaeon]|nr:MAG: DUF483 domain-containing protein [Candidatus Bathyarchaeota archaeon]
MDETRLLQKLMGDPKLKTRVKVENLLLVHLGLRQCSQTVLPVDLPNAEGMGSTIDRRMAPKMIQIQRVTDPRRKLAAIASLKKEMRTAYDKVVRASDQYKGLLSWARDLRLRTRLADVRPTVQELYLFKEGRVGGRLKGLMKSRQKIRARVYASAKPGMERIRLAYPEEFEGSWLREMGEMLGYPGCCVEAYVSDREREFNVEERAARQLAEAEQLGNMDPLAYYVGYFFPCTPDCEQAASRGRECLESLADLDPSLGELYSTLVAGNLENVRLQPEVIARYRARVEGGPEVRP